MSYYFDWGTPLAHIPDLLRAAVITIAITLISFAIAAVLGALFGYIRYRKKPAVIYRILTVYIEIARNTPLLVQIFIIYYGLPQVGIFLNNYLAGIIAIAFNGSAYIAEIFRAGIQSIDQGQWEAGKCIGLARRHIFFDVILPQTLRNIFPALINQFVSTLYFTTLLSALDVREITDVTTIIATNTFRTFEMYTFAIILYYILSGLTTFALRKINVRFFPSVSSKGE